MRRNRSYAPARSVDLSAESPQQQFTMPGYCGQAGGKAGRREDCGWVEVGARARARARAAEKGQLAGGRSQLGVGGEGAAHAHQTGLRYAH